MKVLVILQPVRTSRSVTAAPPAHSFRQTERKDEREGWLFFTTVIPWQTCRPRPLKAKTLRLHLPHANHSLGNGGAAAARLGFMGQRRPSSNELWS